MKDDDDDNEIRSEEEEEEQQQLLTSKVNVHNSDKKEKNSKDNTFVSPKDQYKNKYVITLEGNSFPGRLSRDLASDSLVLYGSIFSTWLNTKIKPFVHYIPIPIESSMMSPLSKIMNWVVANDEIVEEIAHNGQELGYKHSNLVDMQAYTLLVWIEYASLCEFTEW